MTIQPTASRATRLLVTCLTIGLMVAACGSDDESSTTTTTAAPVDDVCADSEALSASLADLQDVDVTADGTNGLEDALGAVQDDLEALGESAGNELQPQVDDVRGSLQELETAITNFGSEGPTQVLDAIAAVASSSSTLITSLDDGACG